MGKFIGGIVFTLLVIAIGGYCYLRLGMVNMVADQAPSRLERRLAGLGSIRRSKSTLQI